MCQEKIIVSYIDLISWHIFIFLCNNFLGKASKYGAEAVLELKPIEGNWVLVESLNFRKYLQKIGVGNRSRDLVMRILLTLRIRQVHNRK